jgi:uncharacterized membrane protein SirB2
MIFHLIGFGILFSTVLAGWILHHQYMSASDSKTKGVILASLRPIGLLSPLAILIMLVTGVGNMHVRGLGLFTEPWLSTKIVFFLFAAANGVFFGIRSGKRRKLFSQVIDGKAPAGSDEKMAAFDKQMRVFFIIQLVLLLLILVLSIVKPGPSTVPH